MNEAQKQRITAEEVVNELKQNIKENYIVRIEKGEENESAFVLRYLNGQKFLLNVKEITE